MSRHAIDPKELTEELTRYALAVASGSRPVGGLSDRLGQMCLSMVDGMAKRPNFSGYEYLEDMKADAILSLVGGLHNYKKGGNAFGYMSMISWRAMVKRIAKEHRQYAAKLRIMMNAGITLTDKQRDFIANHLRKETERSGKAAESARRIKAARNQCGVHGCSGTIVGNGRCGDHQAK